LKSIEAYVNSRSSQWKKYDLGFDADLVHQVHVESLKEFASVKTVDEVVETWEQWAKAG
jgi:hypothetical protein